MGERTDGRGRGAAVALRLGARPVVTLEVTATPEALWAVAGLVAAALLGSAAIVRGAGSRVRG